MVDLPHGVVLADEGARQFVTQRGYWTPPYTSCMFASLAMLLEWSGYQLPLARRPESLPPDNFVRQLHLASGRSLKEGSTIADTRTALKKLLPGTPVQFGTMSNEEFIDALDKGAGIRVSARCSDMPHFLQRWSGGSDANHAYAVIGTRANDGVREIYWLDPMGRPGLDYAGDWIPFSDVRDVLHRSNGELIVTVIFKDAAADHFGAQPAEEPAEAGNAALAEPAGQAQPEGGTMQLVNWTVNRVGDVASGTPIYDLNRRLIKATQHDWVGKPILAESKNGNYYIFGHKLGGRKVVVAVEKTNVSNPRTVDPATLVSP